MLVSWIRIDGICMYLFKNVKLNIVTWPDQVEYDAVRDMIKLNSDRIMDSELSIIVSIKQKSGRLYLFNCSDSRGEH